MDTSRQSTRSTIKEITLGSEELDRKAYDILSKKLHPQAESLVRTLVDDFATTLVYQAKLLAFRRKDEVVLSNHILDSVDIVRRERQRGWTREIIIFVGSALFGAFIPGILTEFGRGPEANFL
ncbi:MAG: hypothetical protein KC547_20355, partial [Anaerolineae bacterium]|nr:hypothetical protein [Anaerolineae bacterium]